MTDQELLQALAFSETKDEWDAPGIMHTALNRLKRPKRFGSTLREVVHAPDQYTGVGTPEWYKATSQNLNKDETEIYDQFGVLANAVLSGAYEDPTGGADHYYNPAKASPSWGEKTTPEAVAPWHNYYQPTGFETDHRYFKETLRRN